MFNNLTTFTSSSSIFYDLQRDIRDLFQNFGFEVTGSEKFPLYNCRYTKEKDLVLELAVAGYTKDRLEIEETSDTLIVKGTPTIDPEKPSDLYTVHQIANKPFTKIFQFTHDFTVKSVIMDNGILRITITIKGAKDARRKITIS